VERERREERGERERREREMIEKVRRESNFVFSVINKDPEPKIGK
jgi:hypothetical protein